MAHRGTSQLPKSQESRQQNTSLLSPEIDPLGSDDSLIDITEEGLTNSDQPIFTDAETSNLTRQNSIKGDTSAAFSQPARPRISADTDVARYGSSDSYDKGKPSIIHSLPFHQDGRRVTPEATGVIPTPSQDSRQRQEFLQTRLLQSQQHHAGLHPTHARPEDLSRTEDQSFLGDPTFAGSFSPITPSPLEAVGIPGGGRGGAVGLGVDSSRIPGYGGGWSPGTAGIDVGLGGGCSSFHFGQPRRSSSPLGGGRPRQPTAAASERRASDKEQEPRDGRRSVYNGTEETDEESIFRKTGPANRDFDFEESSIYDTAKIPPPPSSSSLLSSSPSSSLSTRQGGPRMQAYENHAAVPSIARPHDPPASSLFSAAPSSSHARDTPAGTNAVEQRRVADEDTASTGRARRMGGRAGATAASRGPVAFQRNSYGYYSALPYTSIDIPASYRDTVDDADSGHHDHHHHHPHHQSAAASSGETATPMTSFRHCHRANPVATVDKVAKRQLVAVVGLCLLFMIGEAVGGALSNSLALFTDVLHLGSDLISFIISLFALFLSNKGATKTMSFGYHRAEVLGALFSVFLIWLVSGVLCYIAVERIVQEHYKNVKPDEMLITASLGVVFNIVMAIVLHSEWCCKQAHSHSKFGHGHSHGGGGHGHSHGGHSKGHDNHYEGSEYEPLQCAVDFEDDDYVERHDDEDKTTNGGHDPSQNTVRRREAHATSGEEGGKGKNQHKNLNVRAAFIHVVGDIIQSLGVLVAALIIKFKPEEKYRLADPICTFLFSVLVLITTIAVLRDTIRVMMEGVPRDLSYDSLKRDLLSLDGVVMVHSLHIWALTISRNAVAVHLAVDDPRIHHQVLSSATYMIQTRHRFHYSTIQVELYEPDTMTSCQKCIELDS